MENNRVIVMCSFKDTVRRNNNVYDVISTATVEIAIDRHFMLKLETAVIDFKELGTVTVWYDGNTIGTLEKTSYTVGENRVEFERFGGKIAKAFFSAIDEKID